MSESGKGKIDFAFINSRAMDRFAELVATWLPNGHRKNGEWVALNPNRADKTEGSFSINIRKGVWREFAGDDSEKGGDPISLYAYLNNMSQGDAAKALAEELGLDPRALASSSSAAALPKPESPAPEWEVFLPVPDSAPAPPNAHIKRGWPERSWTYRDADGQVLGYICRFKKSDGGKEILPLVYGRNKHGVVDWGWVSFPIPRPLYGLDRLAAKPEACVIITEGEKCADTAHEVLPEFASVSWPGGCNAVDKVDFSPLAGREVVLWPDADSQRERLSKAELEAGVSAESKPYLSPDKQPGQAAMLKIAAKLHALGCRVSILELPTPGTLPDGWDIADMARAADWAPDEARTYIARQQRPYEPPPPEPDKSEKRKPKASLPAPVLQDGEVTPGLARLLENFALVAGTTKVYNLKTPKLMTMRAFEMLVGGKAIAKAWAESPHKKKIDEIKARRLAKEGAGGDGLLNAMERFVYLEGTANVWDSTRRKLMALKDLKPTIPNEFEIWLHHPARRMIPAEKLIFDPKMKESPEDTINMFDGLKLEPVHNVSQCQAIEELLLFLCNGDRDILHWVKMWLAYPLQHMGTKMASALLFHGTVQGAGKSLFFDEVMRPIYGPYSTTVGQHQLDSQYTEWRSNMLYVLFEEILSNSTKHNHIGTVKHMTTGKTQRIEKKFVSGWEEANYMNGVFLSNEVQPLPIEADDRRFLVVWPPGKLPDDLKARVRHELANGGSAAWYGYLLEYGIDPSFNSHSEPPMTAAKQRLIEYSMPPWMLFHREWKAGRLEVPYCSAPIGLIFDAYVYFCQKWRLHALSLNKLSSNLETVERHKPNCKCLNPDTKKSGQYSFLIIHTKPEDKTEYEWLSACASEFYSAFRRWKKYDDDSDIA